MNPRSQRNVETEDNFFVDCFGYGLAGLLFAGFVSVVFGLFWVVFCWPGASAPHWVPYLMPLRTTLIVCLCLIFYRQTSRPRTPNSGHAREWELISLLALVVFLATVRFYNGANDGATVPVPGYEYAVEWRRSLNLGIPVGLFTLFGYVQSRVALRTRKHADEQVLVTTNGSKH